MIYLDNAATSFPKPPQVVDTIRQFLTEVGASPGRSGHSQSVEAGRIVYGTREALATLFNIDDPLRIAFGHNVTEALNLSLKGLLRPGDHVVTSSIEHNAVMRPLRTLEREGVRLSLVSCSPEGILDPDDVARAITRDTRLIVINHASNVTGALLPIDAVGRIARDHGVLFLVDAAQTAGSVPIDVKTARIDLLAFTGHKSLMGPTGTGGLFIGPRVNVDEFQSLIQGGTGSGSELEEQPEFLPDKFESGTANAVGLAGLGSGVRFVLDTGVGNIRAHEMQLTQSLLENLSAVSRVKLYGPRDPSRQTAIVTFNVEGLEPSEVSYRLDQDHGIMSRPGLHCAPSAHRTVGTYPQGTVRFGLGYFNTAKEVAAAGEAVRSIAEAKT